MGLSKSKNALSPLNMPLEERPRERLQKLGADALSVVELLAIILGSGTKEQPVLQLSQALITHFGSLQDVADATVAELCAVKGLGQAKAVQLKAACSLAKRLSQHINAHQLRVDTPQQAYDILKHVFEGEKRELFVVLMLNTKGFFLHHAVIAIGSLNETIVHPREVLYPAIRHKAASLIIAHNHPSGDLTPSRHDIHLTEQLICAADIIGIPINDHIIVAKDSFKSFRELGIGGFKIDL